MVNQFETIGPCEVPVVPITAVQQGGGTQHVWFHLTPSRPEQESDESPPERAFSTDLGSVAEYVSRRPVDWGLVGGAEMSETVEVIYAETDHVGSLAESEVSIRALQLNPQGRIDLSLDFDYFPLPDETSRWLKADTLGLSLSYYRDP